MRETPPLGISYNKKTAKMAFHFKVKTFMTRGQFACNSIILLHQRLNVVHSNSYLAKKNSHFLSYSTVTASSALEKDFNFFSRWLVGIVDGCKGPIFIIKAKDKNWTSICLNLQFCISLILDNQRVLNYIKSKLKKGRIITEKNNNLAQLKIKDLAQIEKVILPIFDKYPLLTRKAVDYSLFRQAVCSTERSKFCLNKKLNDLNHLAEIDKASLIGFVEVASSFYLIEQANNRIVHGFKLVSK